MKFLFSIILLTCLSVACGGKLYIPVPPGDEDSSNGEGDSDYTSGGGDSDAGDSNVDNGDYDTGEGDSDSSDGDSDNGSDNGDSGTGEGDVDNGDGDSDVFTCEVDEMVSVCHYPPGNTPNPQDVEVVCQNLEDHLKHGDYIGECE